MDLLSASLSIAPRPTQCSSRSRSPRGASRCLVKGCQGRAVKASAFSQASRPRLAACLRSPISCWPSPVRFRIVSIGSAKVALACAFFCCSTALRPILLNPYERHVASRRYSQATVLADLLNAKNYFHSTGFFSFSVCHSIQIRYVYRSEATVSFNNHWDIPVNVATLRVSTCIIILRFKNWASG